VVAVERCSTAATKHSLDRGMHPEKKRSRLYNSQKDCEVKMDWLKDTLQVQTHGKGLYDFTGKVDDLLQAWNVQEGICHLFIQHTSASLTISENYDPTAKMDMETFMEKLVPEGQAWYRHTVEGDDDSTSHIRSILTAADLSIPVDRGKLSLGTWQGIYIFEHRRERQRRQVLVRCLKIS
jgi:secondary thiamine-phosphate synthase enzyme